MATAAETRALFPAALSAPYLGTNGYGLMPTPTRAALDRAVASLHERGYAAHHRLEAGIETVRGSVAGLVGAGVEEVAFTRNTADGIGFVADAFPWRPGDEVLVFDGEYGTVLYPFLGAQARGGPTVRVVPLPDDGVVTAAAVAAACTPATRAVVLSWVRFDTGARADLAALGEACAALGVWLVVDAIQGLGLFDVDVHACGVTALAAGTHKWLCGVAGLGVLFVDSSIECAPVRTGLGAITAERQGDVPGEASFVLRPELARIEDGAAPELAIAALGASIDVLTSVVDRIAHVRTVTEHLVDRWRSIGGDVVAPRTGDAWSGIVAVRPPPTMSIDDALARAWSERIVVGPIRGAMVPSVHVYTSLDDVNAFVDAIAP